MTVWRNDKRGGKWSYHFQVAGKRHSGYAVHPETGQEARSKREAEQVEALIRERARKAAAVAHALPKGEYALAEAAAAHAVLARRFASWPTIAQQLSEIVTFFGPATAISTIDQTRIVEYREWAMVQPVRIWTGLGDAEDRDDARNWKISDRFRSPRTINYRLKTLGAVLRRAASSRDPVTGLPLLHSVPLIELLPVVEGLPRPVPLAVVADVLDNAAEHVAHAVELAARLGMRKREVLTLERHQVDFEQGGVWLAGAATKARRAEFVPADPSALALLARLVARARAAGQTRLILYQPPGIDENGRPKPLQPVNNIKRGWRTAMNATGVKHRFHDLKATFVTAVARTAPAATVQQLARHKSFETTRAYLKSADDLARRAVDSLADLLPTRIHDPQTKEAGENRPPLKALKSLANSMVGAAGFEPTTPSPPD